MPKYNIHEHKVHPLIHNFQSCKVAAMSGNTSSILNNYNVNTVNSAITQSCITMSFSTTLPSSIYYVSINLSTSASYNMQKLASVLYIPFTGSVPRLLNADIIVYQ